MSVLCAVIVNYVSCPGGGMVRRASYRHGFVSPELVDRDTVLWDVGQSETLVPAAGKIMYTGLNKEHNFVYKLLQFKKKMICGIMCL